MALYKPAEYAVEAALTLAHESGEWLLADEALPAFKKLLALHDSQLAVAPLHKVTLFFFLKDDRCFASGRITTLHAAMRVNDK
ncbi:hypothetical protein [Paraburkholderia terrae]|uniref:hypothetical protein n=1 Tax=Paraburkholderia terrae TaxID=311230 RepID=UPI001EE2D9AC|nr:hypothetical protein [Paraburkholderia terrae]GJH01566.1 hypothetical protein CBA19C8_13435 [Paraburkholderia terrae]